MPHLHLLRRLAIVTSLAVGAGSLGACSAPVGSGTSDLFEAPLDALPLATIEAREWQLAPAGCEDLLPDTVSFEVARGANGLLVAVDDDGEAVCTDTYEAIQEELADAGREEESDDLEAAFRATIGSFEEEPEDVHVDPTGDDPSPQPSCPNPTGRDMEMSGAGPEQPGDPSPQPS